MLLFHEFNSPLSQVFFNQSCKCIKGKSENFPGTCALAEQNFGGTRKIKAKGTTPCGAMRHNLMKRRKPFGCGSHKAPQKYTWKKITQPSFIEDNARLNVLLFLPLSI